MKKFLILALAASIIYFGWRYMPESWKTKIGDAADYVGLTKITKETITPPIRSWKDKILPDDPATTRAVLVDQLGEKLDIIKENKSPKTAAERAVLDTALKDSTILIGQLREENQKGGVWQRSLDKIAEAIIPGEPPPITSCASQDSN